MSRQTWINLNHDINKRRDSNSITPYHEKLDDISKELLVSGYIRIETNDKLQCPVDVIRLSIQYMSVNYKRPNIGLCVIGHINSGKSTLCGRLLYDLGVITKDKFNKIEQETIKSDQNDAKYAWCMDIGADERNLNLTIHWKLLHFYNKFFHYGLIDVPGSTHYTKNVIAGISVADVAILMVPSVNFEESIVHKKCIDDIEGCTRMHSQICHLKGIKQIIVCINKMDHDSVKYSQKIFNSIKTETAKILKKIGYKIKKIAFIPISAWIGDNIIEKSTNMTWYNGFSVQIKKKTITGYTLMDALNDIVYEPKRNINKRLRLSVSKLYKIKGVGDVITGIIEQGQITPGQSVEFLPTRAKGTCFSVEIFNQGKDKSQCRDTVGINVKRLNKHNMPRRGDIMIIEESMVIMNEL